MRNRKRRKETAIPYRPLLCMAAAALVVVNVVRLNLDSIGRAGEQAAIFSAVLAMPDAGFGVLRDRFRTEIIGDGEVDTPSQEEQQWPPPQVAEPKPAEPVPAEPESSASQAEKGQSVPRIPAKYAAPVIAENFAGYESGSWIKWGNGFIKNDTSNSDEDVEAILETPWSVRFQDPGGEPQVLIVHTHATESFESHDRQIYDTRNTWRSTDNALNMVAVGDAMQQALEDNGISVLHDTTQHDYPSYNGSYERAAETISAYLEEYPSIKVVLDLHRDAMQREESIVKPVSLVEGEQAAQIMIIAACDDDGALGVPEWRENLRFAALFQDYMERDFPELTRPVFFCYRKYNQNLTTGSLLLEFGSNANTLEEAIHSARLAGQALSNLIWDNAAGDGEPADVSD